MDGWLYVCVDGCISEWMISGWMDNLINGW